MKAKYFIKTNGYSMIAVVDQDNYDDTVHYIANTEETECVERGQELELLRQADGYPWNETMSYDDLQDILAESEVIAQIIYSDGEFGCTEEEGSYLKDVEA